MRGRSGECHVTLPHLRRGVVSSVARREVGTWKEQSPHLFSLSSLLRPEEKKNLLSLLVLFCGIFLFLLLTSWHHVSYRLFWVDILDQIEEIPLYFWFAGSFYQEGRLEFVRCFFSP